MVTAAQARAAGVSRVDVARLFADGVLEPVSGAVRVYRLVGAPPDPDRDPVRAAWLQLGDGRPASRRLRVPDAVVAGRSAALMLGLGDLGAGVHEFWVSSRRQLRRDDVQLLVRRDLPADAWSVVEGLPVSTPARVVADLFREREDGSAIARVSQDAVAAGRLSIEALAEVAAPHAAAYGASSPKAFVAELLGSTSPRPAAVTTR
jgi:hypothetical protein